MKIYEQGKHLDGTHNDIVHYYKAKKVEIYAEKPLAVCLEGEEVVLHNPIIEIADKKIKMLIPDKYVSNGQIIQND